MFSGGSKGNIGNKRVKYFLLFTSCKFQDINDTSTDSGSPDESKKNNTFS